MDWRYVDIDWRYVHIFILRYVDIYLFGYTDIFSIWYTDIFIICLNIIFYYFTIKRLIRYFVRRNVDRDWWLMIIFGRYADICILRYVDIYLFGYTDIFLFGMPTFLLFFRSRNLTESFLVDTLTGTEGIRRETLLWFLEIILFDMATSFFDTDRSLTMLMNHYLVIIQHQMNY